MKPRNLLAPVLLAAFLAACGSGPHPSAPAPTATTPAATLSPAPTGTPQAPALRLTLWLAPAFSPQAQGPAGTLLAARLAAFEQAHPGVTLGVRLKARSGTAGLAESLAAVGAAAPALLPDVISLDPGGLSSAAAGGQAAPLDGLMPPPAGPEWYAFAVTGARVNGSFVGLPFASDAMVLVYRADRYPSPPHSWADLLNGPAPVLLPAGDPAAAFVLAQYAARGSPLADDAGRPSLDPAALAEVLAFFASGRASGVVPASDRQFASADDTWAAFRTGRAASAAAPLSAFLGGHDPRLEAAVPLPTRDGSGVCFAEPWTWVVVTRDPTRRALAAGLVEWLSQPEFLGPWTRALGLMPSTSSALALWPQDGDTATVSRLVTAARLVPPAPARAAAGPAIRDALEAVLTGNTTPEQAAESAAQAVQAP